MPLTVQNLTVFWGTESEREFKILLANNLWHFSDVPLKRERGTSMGWGMHLSGSDLSKRIQFIVTKSSSVAVRAAALDLVSMPVEDKCRDL